MATQAGHETRDPVETEYFIWSPPPSFGGSSVAIHLHPDVMDGIARDITESPVFEVGGLLLGSVSPQLTASGAASILIRIDRYHRIDCAHLAGPEFVLDAVDIAGLEKTAAAILSGGEFSAVGLYRSQIRPGLELEPSDAELIARYFNEPFDLALLIKRETAGQMSGQFLIKEDGAEDSPMQAAGEVFPWRSGQAPGMNKDRAKTFAPPTMRSRRLIPDYVPDAVEPSHVRMPDPHVPDPETPSARANWTRWWPLPASFVVAGLALWMLLAPTGKRDGKPAPAPVAETGAARPLGLYASESGKTWRVSWNPNASSLREARSVQLFIREGDEQNRIELTPQDLATGTYTSPRTTDDVTFRLEVTDNSGRVGAESFRFVREAPAPVVAAAPAEPTKAPGLPQINQPQITPPRAVHKVPPSIPDSVQSRIKGTVVIEVRVRVDAKGRVVSATPAGKHAGLNAYLAGRAVGAAKSWRFEPAREGGKPVPGEQNIRFTFNNK